MLIIKFTATEQLGYAMNLRSGEKLTATELAHRLATQKRVLLSELHDSPRHHQAQHWLLKTIYIKTSSRKFWHLKC